MSRRCDLTDTGVMTGNNVSHANNRTRRRFIPNLHKVTLYSEALGEKLSFRVTAATLRSIDHNDGLDGFLTSTANGRLSELGVKLKRRIKKAMEKKSAA